MRKIFVCIFLALSLQFSSPINSGTITKQKIETTVKGHDTAKAIEIRTKYETEEKERIKQCLIDEVDSYIKNDFPGSKLEGTVIVDLCLKHDIDPAFILAQGKIESGFGTAGKAKRTNSVWNVGAYDGQPVHKSSKFKHPNQSIEPYIILIKEKYLGKDKTVHDLMSNYVSLDGYRYASAGKYEKILKQEYKHIRETTQIYEFFSMLKQ